MKRVPAILQRDVGVLLDLLGREFAVEPGHIIGGGRTKALSRARFALVMLLRERYQLSYPELGRMCECDHSTAIHAVQRAQGLEDDSELYRLQVASVRRAWLTEVPSGVHDVAERYRVA